MDEPITDTVGLAVQGGYLQMQHQNGLGLDIGAAGGFNTQGGFGGDLSQDYGGMTLTGDFDFGASQYAEPSQPTQVTIFLPVPCPAT